MRIQDIMTADPACCTPDTRLQDAARLMLDNDCGEIPVVSDVDSRRLVGVITDRDIAIRAVAEGLSPADTRVSEVMSSSVVTARLEDSADEACELMEENQVRRIPVIDREGRCCGIISQADIALRSSEKEAGEVVRGVSRPGQSTPTSPNVRM